MIFNNIIIFLFIGFGLYAIINPKSISIEENKKSYETQDLVKGWGIYSVTIGALLIFHQPFYANLILRMCFISSIIWHIEIVKRRGWTPHHKHAIIVNLVVFIFTFF
jgi:hypothetical protein